MKTTQVNSFIGGHDRSTASIRASREGFYTLSNFRQSLMNRGLLEQTPYFTSDTINSGTTFIGAEPSTSAVRGGLNHALFGDTVVVTDYCVSTSSSTQLQVIRQTAAPATESVNTCCLLLINNLTGLALTLNNTVDIVIDGATTFKWRKNGGAYTTLVPIVLGGVSIDGGNASVYFLTTTGFSVNDTWSWTRTDATFETSPVGNANLTRSIEHEAYKNEIFWIDNNGRVMTLKKTASSGELHVITYGYRPAYGLFLTVYEGHLFIFGFSTTQYTTGSSAITTQLYTIRNSDSVDIYNLLATDVNEADSYLLQNSELIVGHAKVNQLLFVWTLSTVYYTPYSGLPTPFNFKEFTKFSIYQNLPANFLYGNSNCAIGRTTKAFVFGVDGLYIFNGNTFTYIYQPMRSQQGSLRLPYMYYDVMRSELIVVNSTSLQIYQEQFGTWYTRTVSFTVSGSSPAVGTLFRSDKFGTYLNRLSLGLHYLRIPFEDTDFTQQPLMDSGVATSYTVPTITTQPVWVDDFSSTSDIGGTYLIASLLSGISATYYTTGSALKFKLYWYTTDVGNAASALTDTAATWDTSKPDGWISYPRVSARVLMLEIRLIQVSTKPPAGGQVYALDPIIRGANER